MKLKALKEQTKEIFTLPSLPYPEDGLEPHISKETVKFHYGKHHQGYVDKLNKLIKGTDYEQMSLKDIVEQSSDDIFNNAAQVWNHTFYWTAFNKEGSKQPSNEVKRLIEDQFDSFSLFKEQFEEQCKSLFGSGWVWLVVDTNNQLKIEIGKDAENPLTEDKVPLLVCDMWEHAWYLDYQNDKDKYLKAFWKLIDWNVISSRLDMVDTE